MVRDFILASGSIHRKQLLLSADFEPKEIITADIDETPYLDETPADYVQRMAKTKAKAVHALMPDDIVLAAIEKYSIMALSVEVMHE